MVPARQWRVELAGGERRARHACLVAPHRRPVFADKLNTTGGPSSTQTIGIVHMEGSEVFRHAVGKITDVVENVLPPTGYTVPISTGSCRTRPTSASSTAPATSCISRPKRWSITVDRHANTSAASVPLALTEGVGDGRIKRGDLVMIEAMGGGFTWGASLIRW